MLLCWWDVRSLTPASACNQLVLGTNVGYILQLDLFLEQVWGTSSIELTFDLFPEQIWGTSSNLFLEQVWGVLH